MKKYIIIGTITVAALALVAGVWFMQNSDYMVDNSSAGGSPEIEALDIAIDFYNEWLSAAQSTSTDPYAAGLLDSPLITQEVKSLIEEKQANYQEGDLDPVLCQSSVPKRIGGKQIFTTETEAQIMMLARGFETKSRYQAIVNLKAVDGGWQITKIDCSEGDTAPEGEFAFDQTGNLLKQSVQSPYNPENWHLVYEEEGVAGYVLPLTFNLETVCVEVDGTETSCNMEQLSEGLKVRVQADMTEEGGIVKKLYFQ